VQSWNPAAERVFGYSEAEALGKTANELIVPEPARVHVDGVWEKITDGKLETASVNENITRDGRTILCEWTNTPYFDKDGNVTGIISVAQDISGRKQAETVMIQSEKMTMIAGMAAGMAHEVNNPLGIIAQDLQNLERRFSPTLPANGKIADELGLNLDLVEQYMERRDITIYIANMRKAVKRASNIISNMLQFSRQSDASHQLFNFNDVIEQSIKLASNDYDLRKKYDFKNVSISREYSENMPMVSLCITEIEQVIINLLKNAAQAMFDAETSSPSIHIRTFFENGYVVVTFNDNGPGMTEEVKKRIFDPFFTTKEVGLGTGLGLSVSYTIVTKNHGGELSVETQLGRGACFTVGIPVAAF
jgi:PAS domain S-box-containing protein